jgi:hypothetical protein
MGRDLGPRGSRQVEARTDEPFDLDGDKSVRIFRDPDEWCEREIAHFFAERRKV